MRVDVLAIGAHPDDVDLGVGGFICKLTAAGKRVAILDLSEGELGSRGTVSERRDEARAAAALLGVVERRNAKLPDGSLANTPEQRMAVIRMIRELQPRIILSPMAPDRHPDHVAAHQLVKDANFFAGVHGLDTGQPAYRAATVYGYLAYQDIEQTPTHVVDVSAEFELKLKALRAFRSQFHNPDYAGAETLVASEGFWDGIRVRAAYWGGRIGATYGEPLYGTLPLYMNLPRELEDPS